MVKKKLVFLRQAARLALKSGCLRGKRGAVVVKNGQILVSAYNTVFPNNRFCQEHGCLRDKLKLGLGKELEKCRSIHAEAKAITLAAKKGVSLSGATLFMTSQPCINCAKLIFASGIKKVFYLDIYGDKTGEVFLKELGVDCERVKLEKDESQKRLRDIKMQEHA
ncbi:dCMP deaminase family protein [Candidatus Shapirobacteria bacterium]|nr:dCMP deaminase family protein [Candidatus Shapirobacteria bacterium]